MKRGGLTTVAATVGALAPGAVQAHASERAVVLILPTGPYIFGAGFVVAITAFIAAAGQRAPAFASVQVFRRPMLPESLTSWISAICLWGLIGIGLYGSHDPLENPLPLAIWTVLWVGLTLLSAVFGNLWGDLNPWRGPVRLLRALLNRHGGIGLARLGHWPAVAGYLGFAWYESISLAPDQPASLALVVGGYWLVILVLAVAEGEDWLKKGEFLTMFFGLVARIAPVWGDRQGDQLCVMAGWPGAQILRCGPLAKGGFAFVTLLLASVSFDGLHESFWWLGRIGVNPLEYPGRSAVIGINTAGLLMAWAVMAALIGAAILPTGAGARLVLSLLPIAAGYHIAHYFVALLTQGQYAIAALNDPFETGQHLLGLPENWVSFGFLSQETSVRLIWQTQVVVILGAHLLAVLLAEKIMRDDGAAPGHARKLPLTVLMVLYTIFGLWLLATPSVA